MSSQTKRLIINADDFGLTSSVNNAIIDVYKAGNLTSTTLMINMAGSEEAIELSRQNPGLAIGLHFCITEGRPLTDCASLLDEEGYFTSRGMLIKRCLKHQIKEDDLQKEFLAQYDKAIAAGIDLTHIDSHQHILQIPFVYQALNPIFQRKGLKLRSVSPNKVKFSLAPSQWKRSIKTYINALYSKKIKAGSTCKTNDVIVSIHDKNPEVGFSKETYIELLEECSSEDVIELMVHPYILGDDLLKIYEPGLDAKMPFLKKCDGEYKLLSGAPIFTDYELISFRDL